MKYGNLTLGQVEAVLNMVGGEAGAKRLLGGFSEVVLKGGVIDCDAPPQIPFLSDRVIEHRKNGTVLWDPSMVKLHVTEKQRSLRDPDGNKLRESLKGLRLVNANVLDYLLEHQDLIPEEWEHIGGVRCFVVFWGTIYSGEKGEYVRALTGPSLESAQWHDHCVYLDWRQEDSGLILDECVPALLWV